MLFHHYQFGGIIPEELLLTLFRALPMDLIPKKIVLCPDLCRHYQDQRSLKMSDFALNKKTDAIGVETIRKYFIEMCLLKWAMGGYK